MAILDTIFSHDDLIKLNATQKLQLCDEIREFLISNISKTGGHLASNLGVVELTVAIETVFDTRNDRLVFDVGHQSYVHKLLTGRQADFAHLRQFGGIAGFPKPCESDTDSFVAGHASNSVSIALGMARARTLQKQDYNVVSVMGDGAATGGMAYEGLNDAAVSKEPMIVILNDNEMSIDRNVGGMAKHLSRLRTKERYIGAKEKYRSLLSKVPGSGFIFRVARVIRDWVKRIVLPGTIFENMGMAYLGPVDGHDLPELIRVLNVARDMKEPVLVHVLTHKGHGYKYAEDHPSKFHGVGKFDPESGEVPSKATKTFSEAFGETMLKLAQKNEKVCAITAAMPGGTGLLEFKEKHPDRLFDVGIAEEHAVSMAGGLAKQGMVPVVALYSTFLQRSYDQILQDICMLKLHVVLAIDRAGLVGEDGETHHGVFDVGFLRQMPGMQILCPSSCEELSYMLESAVTDYNGPVAIRYPRGGFSGVRDWEWTESSLFCHRDGEDITIITYGTMIDNVLAAADILKEQGIEANVLRLTSIAPLCIGSILDAIEGKVLIVEEAIRGSGIHETLAWELHQKKPELKISAMDLGDKFVTHGSLHDLYHSHGLDAESIANRAMEVLKSEN